MCCGNFIRAIKAHPGAGLIILFEFLQRFSHFGFQTLLFLYIKHELKFSVGASIATYHLLQAIGFFTPVIFSIITDKLLSKYCTIMIAAFITLLGDILVILAASSAGPSGLESVFPHIIFVSLVGFVIRSIGVGGMREEVRSFGREQFCLPEEEILLRAFYQFFYFATVVGTVSAIVTVPLLRMHVECYGQLYCFPLGFAVPTVALLLAIMTLLCACSSLNWAGPEGSVVLETIACVSTALSNRGAQCGPTWLDNAGVVFMDSFICDVRPTLNVLVIFLPLPIFWALFEQQATLWIYQATRMIWPIESYEEWYVEPDHMLAFSYLATFVALPVVESCLYKLCRRIFCCRTARKRMMIGLLLALSAYVTAAFVELKVEPTYVQKPVAGEADLVVFNPTKHFSWTVDVDYVNVSYKRNATINKVDYVIFRHLPVTRTQDYNIKVEKIGTSSTMTVRMTLIERRVGWLYFPYDSKTPDITKPKLFLGRATDDLPFDMAKCDIQLPMVNLLYSNHPSVEGLYPNEHVRFVNQGREKNTTVFMDSNHHGYRPFHMYAGNYEVNAVNQTNKVQYSFKLKRGGVYAVIFMQPTELLLNRNTTLLVPPNTVRMEWQIPQYLLLGLAYFLYPVTLLQFANEQVPVRMRPVLLAAWYLSIAFGNLLVASLAFTAERLLHFYALYGSLMGLAVMMVPICLCNFELVEPDDDEDTD